MPAGDNTCNNYKEKKKYYSTTNNNNNNNVNTIIVEVDVIIPVYNASDTIEEAVLSAMNQKWIIYNNDDSKDDNNIDITIYVCCYNDASTDNSWEILQQLKQKFDDSTNRNDKKNTVNNETEKDLSLEDITIPSYLLISNAPNCTSSRGAGFARNRAVQMRQQQCENNECLTTTTTNSKKDDSNDNNTTIHRLLCWLDSDDIMHQHRIYYQVITMLGIKSHADRINTLVGCQFNRIPINSTWHYTEWVNNLSNERLLLEQFREITIIQPTWMMYRERFEQLGGYIEIPSEDVSIEDFVKNLTKENKGNIWRLVHPVYETSNTIRVAEDLRLFYEHINLNGILMQCRNNNTKIPLVTYRHRIGQSQSSQTSRKLLLQLRVIAFEYMILKDWSKFIIWGAGRDGKDFVKALSNTARNKVVCMVDVDDIKIARGFYEGCDQSNNNHNTWKIPIVHFSLLVKDETKQNFMYNAWKCGYDYDNNSAISFGRIDKKKKFDDNNSNNDTKEDSVAVPNKKLKTDTTNNSVQQKKKDPGINSIDRNLLRTLPVVVCVAMYRTNGALENNVQLIGRTEGKDLWHFS